MDKMKNVSVRTSLYQSESFYIVANMLTADTCSSLVMCMDVSFEQEEMSVS